MADNSTRVRDYLKQHGAIGAQKAIPMKTVATALLGNGGSAAMRMLRKSVYEERSNGALICSSTGERNGYYLPANEREIVDQWSRLEAGIKKKARPLRPFRNFVGRIKQEERDAAEGPGLFPGTGTDGRPSLQDGGPSPAEPPAPEGRERHPGAEPAMDLLQTARPDFYPLPESGDGAGKHED